MIKNKSIVAGFLFVISSIITIPINAQGWNCFTNSCKSDQRHWTINLNAGTTSCFGDLSIFDNHPLQKMQDESGLAFGIIGTRYFNNIIGLSAQVLTGKMNASLNSISFQSSFIEYNLHGRVNLLGFINKFNDSKFKWEVYAGAGQLLYQTSKSMNNGSDSNPNLHQTQVPEFVYFFGSGISYTILPCITITTDLALRQCQTDRLDNYVKNDDYDYYSYLNFGISYNFCKRN